MARRRWDGYRRRRRRRCAGALVRIAHIINLYRTCGMFGLSDIAGTTSSLAVAMQLLLFLETPATTLAALAHTEFTSATLAVLHSGTGPGSCDDTDIDVSSVHEDVLAAPSRLFAERGHHLVSMEDIAMAAGVSRPTLYRHFSTKVALLRELTDRAVPEGRDVAAELRHLADADLDLDALHAWLGRYVRFHRIYGGVIRAWYDGTLVQQFDHDPLAVGLRDFHAAALAVLGTFCRWASTGASRRRSSWPC